jgi:hypothetical protein
MNATSENKLETNKTIKLLLTSLLVLYLLNPFSYGYLIGYIIVALILVQGSFLAKNLDLDFVLLLLFSLTYALFYSFDYESQGKQFIAIYGVTPPFFYLLGKYLVKEKNRPNDLLNLLFGIATIFSMTAAVSVFLNFLEGGFAQTNRTIDLFWDKKPTSATIMGSFFTLTMCTPALLILGGWKKKIVFRIMVATIFIVSLICCIRLGSRTQLGIFLISTIFAIAYVMPRQNIKNNFILLAFIGVVIYYISTKVSFDLNAEWLTTFSDRMGKKGTDIASGGGRTERWLSSIEYMFKYPLGWELNEFGYAHNLWLDTLRATGIIPFFLLVIYTVRSFNQVRKTLKVDKNNLVLNGQILIYGLAFIMIFMVEPIMDGTFMTFVVFCVYKGIINKYRYDALETATS